MVYNYEITEQAYEDIDHVLKYITVNLCNKKAAIDLMKNIEKSIEDVCHFPMSYPNCRYYYISDEKIRHICVDNYILFYKIKNDKIVFLRFAYSKRNKILLDKAN